MTETMNRCAVYGRVSTDKQSHLSPADQVRKCREFADGNGFDVLDEHIYIDEGLSGYGSDRPAFQELLNAAYSIPRPFDIILVDDTSRFSRSQSEAMSTLEKLKFQGLRVIFVSQGIDTRSEQSDVQMTVHGLVDSLYVKELAKKTHRGLEGLVLRGLHSGGRCYGYITVPSGEGTSKRQVINREEAVVVERIFEMSVKGTSLKKIAKILNAECIPPPRSRSGKRNTWCPTAIRAMLKRDLYKGEKIWNRSRFGKVPGKNKRRSKPRPETEWKRVHQPELAIVSAELWDEVQKRLKSYADKCRSNRPLGLLSRSLTNEHLFSGLLRCSVCGGNMVISTGGGTHRHPKYACSNRLNRGTCSNDLYIRRDELEERLLGNLQAELLQPEEINLAISEFGRQLSSSLKGISSELVQMRQRKDKLEAEIQNFMDAIAAHGHSKSMLEQISVREREISAITERLLAATGDSIQARVEEVKTLVEEGISNLRDLLNENAPLAKTVLHRHLDNIRMSPANDGEGWHYVAEGNWDLLGSDSRLVSGRQPSDWRLEMVAGVGFEPTTFGL
jgi:site-specific DNA recombinase